MKPKPDSLEVSSEQFFSRPRSVEALAEHLDCTPRFLRNEILAGRLKARRLSSRLIRLMPGDVQQWLDAASTTSSLNDNQASGV
jgi:hypothetical protein